ncbi:MAG: M48 family metallopeptidase [Elusimicrobia bacterium]|nr:M48 family metallopeptidase [Elusimicrobiota bacterium]
MRESRRRNAGLLAACLLAAALPGLRAQPLEAARALGEADFGARIRTALAGAHAEGQRRRELEQWWHQHTLGAPYTGRHRPLLLREKWEEDIGRLLYQRLLSGSKLSQDPDRLAMVQRVSARMIAAAGRPDWTWEVQLVDVGPTSAYGVAGDQDQAFALPGGKVGILSGMLTISEGDDGLAAILGHEMAHAVARHLGERITELILVESGLSAAGAVVPPALAVVIPAVVPAAINAARIVTVAQSIYGIGTGQGKSALLAGFSRLQEEEADRIGLVLMAKAGYDPARGVEFWSRLLQETSRPVPPGLMGRIEKHLQVHPITARRIEKMQGWLPGIREQYYRPEASQAR